MRSQFGSAGRRGARPETRDHISFVLLTGDYAYKIKKAVDFGFLDFTTLAARQFFCAEELRLNRRLAPELYLEVVPITGSVDSPVVGGPGPALEYAVKMREFPQDALASRLLAAGQLGPADIDILASRVAEFHGAIAVAAPDGRLAPPKKSCVSRSATSRSLPPAGDGSGAVELEDLRAWTEREHAACATLSSSPRSKASCANATAICISTISRASTLSLSSSTASSSTKGCAGST